MMKVLELRGYKSLRALNAFNALLLGLKMLPAYMGETYEEFLSKIHEMPFNDQLKMIREAAMFVELQKDEVESLVCFCADSNGVPYEASNLKNLGPDQIIEIIVAVCGEIAKMKISILSDNEKKKIKDFSVDVRRVFVRKPDIRLEEALNIAFYEAVYSVF